MQQLPQTGLLNVASVFLVLQHWKLSIPEAEYG